MIVVISLEGTFLQFVFVWGPIDLRAYGYATCKVARVPSAGDIAAESLARKGTPWGSLFNSDQLVGLQNQVAIFFLHMQSNLFS